jgi:hypothetical protein
MTLLEDGWYLMSVRDLELELARRRGDGDPAPSNARRITIDEALDFKARGNVPDDLGRSLRLVLHVADNLEAARLHEKRLVWEPNFHDPPTWRREASLPVNIVPLRTATRETKEHDSWLDDPAVAAMEREWNRSGTVAGVNVPADYRSFVYKTVISLQASKREITVESIANSVERWLNPADASKLRAALETVNG